MKLDHLTLVNWGALRDGDYELGNMTLLTGPTGAGKSTFLDALQTVMTAAYQNIFSYNPGQDETTQTGRNGKTKRTLFSYIAGAEDNLFARPSGAHGYIAAVFKPGEGEAGKPFTALVAVAARVDGSGERRQAMLERQMFLIIEDADITYADLTSAETAGINVVPVEAVERHLKATYSRVLNFRDSKREYLCQLYGRFRGVKSVSFSEAELAARAWSQSIAHKPIGSVDELVKTQILEHDAPALTQRIGQISDLMRQVANLRAEGERLTANIERLDVIGNAADAAIAAHETAVRYRVVAAKRAVRDVLTQETTAKRQIEQARTAIAELQVKARQLDEDRASVNSSQVKVQAHLTGIPAADQKRRIDDSMRDAGALAHASLDQLQVALHQAQELLATGEQLAGMHIPPTYRDLQAAPTKIAAALGTCHAVDLGHFKSEVQALLTPDGFESRRALALVESLAIDWSGLSALYAAVKGNEGSFVALGYAERARLRQAIEDASAKEQELARRKANLATGNADYPNHIDFALRRFREELPASRVQVLCDLVEPVSEAWQPAIEGYLGGARFNFVVETGYERDAIDFTGRNNLRCSVIQGTLCLKNAKPERVPSDSIIHELTTQHPVAKAYLIDQFGSVVKVPDSETLRTTPRGVTQDGKGSGSRTMFGASEATLVLGKAAKQRRLEEVKRSHEAMEKQVRDLRAELQMLEAGIGVANRAQLPTFIATVSLERAARDLDAARSDLSRLDLTEVTKLEAEAAALVVQLRALDEQVAACNTEKGSLDRSIRDRQDSLVALERRRVADIATEEREHGRLEHLVVMNDALSMLAIEAEIDAELARDTLNAHELQTLVERGNLDAGSAYGDVRAALGDYNSWARAEERFEAFVGLEVRGSADFTPIYEQLVPLRRKVRDQLHEQRNVGFVKNLDALRTAEASFKDVFTRQFCFDLLNQVDTGVRTLRQLNAELERLKFGTDQFRIDWSEWVPEFKEYYDFFEAAFRLAEAEDGCDLFENTALSEQNRHVRDRLMALLLANDQQVAQRELLRVADYRNYRRYEIFKESDTGSKVKLSEWGTGSGGQLETPAYIVRAAVVTNRLKHFDKGSNLKLLVNDESFSKMDERRAHDVLRFLRDNLGLQLICAMPTKHAGALKAEFNKEYSFTRTSAEENGEIDFVSEADERDLEPDKLRTLWEARREELRRSARAAFEANEAAVAAGAGAQQSLVV